MLFTNLVRKYSVAILPLATMAVVSCSETEEPMPRPSIPAIPGAAIDFGVVTTPGSRTAYTDDKFQMNWLNADELKLFSDKAKAQTGVSWGKPTYSTGNVSADYSVNLVDEHVYHANLSVNSDSYPLQWPDELNETDIFTFFGAYPLSRVANGPSADAKQFEMHYVTNQRVTVNAKNAIGEYTTNPDMNNAYLMARDTIMPTGQHVLLHFNPIMTTIDVHIHAHGTDHEIGTGIINGMKITGVSIVMPKRVEHGYKGSVPTFTYDLTDASDLYTVEGGKLKNNLLDCQQSVFVGLDNGDDPYVMLNEGESLSLLAFLPPIDGSVMTQGTTKVKIHTAGAYDFVVSLPTKDWVHEGRIDIDLPRLDPDRDKGNIWMKQLPGNLAMTHLTLPGAECDAATTAADVTRWLRAGVRVIDMASVSADASKYEPICDAVAKFLEENTSEFVIVWGDRNAANDSFTNCWTDKFSKATDVTSRNNLDALTVADARSHRVLVFKKGVIVTDKNNIYQVGDNVSGTGYYIKTSTVKKVSDIAMSGSKWNVTGTLTNSSDCDVYYLNDNLNLDVAKELAKYSESTGCAGIIMIPHAGEAFNNLNQVYGDVLLQAVIDCNYKFIIDLK